MLRASKLGRGRMSGGGEGVKPEISMRYNFFKRILLVYYLLNLNIKSYITFHWVYNMLTLDDLEWSNQGHGKQHY